MRSWKQKVKPCNDLDGSSWWRERGTPGKEKMKQLKPRIYSSWTNSGRMNPSIGWSKNKTYVMRILHQFKLMTSNEFGILLILVETLQKNTLPWWYVFVIVGRVFCHACTSMTILWQNQDSYTCAVVEVFHDITKIIITEVSTSMMINGASWKCFRQGWPTCGIHRNGSPISYRVRFWIR